MKANKFNEGLCRLIVETSGLPMSLPVYLHPHDHWNDLPGLADLRRPWRNLCSYDQCDLFLIGLRNSVRKD
jgi:hypothetical protein